MPIRSILRVVPPLILLGGCNALQPVPRGESLVRPVSVSKDDAHDGEESVGAPAAAVTGWADRQRFIFERAWREIRQDMAYDQIDSFGNLEGEARRDVLAMREDLSSDRDSVDTARRRRRADR